MAPQFSAEAVLEAAPVAVVTVDGRGRIVHANRAAERMFGYPPASLAGRRMSEILPGARLPRLLEEPIPRTAPDRPPLPLGRRTAVSGRQADGAEFPLELTLTRSADRRPRYTAWIRKAEPPQPAPRALERSRSLLERVEEFTGAGSWHCDPERSTLEWSPNLYRLFGLQPGERRPTLEWILDHTHPDDRARVEGVLGDVLHGIRPSALEFRITPAGGGVRHLRAIAGRETVAERPTLLTGVIKDVTAELAAEREIAARQAVSAALARWRSFEQGAHDLVRELGTALECAAGTLWLPQNDQLIPSVNWILPELADSEFDRATRALRLPRGVGLPGWAWQQRLPVDLASLPEERFLRQEAARSVGLRGAFAIPALSNREVLAVIDVHTREERTATERLMLTLGGLAWEIGAFLARRRGQLRQGPLTEREVEVLQHAARGLTTAEIAVRLTLTRSTVKTHVEHIFAKLGVSDRASAVANAFRLGLIE